MALQPEPVALIFHNDVTALMEAVRSDEHPGAPDALKKYATLLRDVLIELCGLREFSHIEFLEVDTSYTTGGSRSPLAGVLGTPLKNEEGELVGVADVKHALDVFGALTAGAALPEVLSAHVGLDEEGLLGFTDEPSRKLSEKFGDRLRLDDRYPAVVSEEEEVTLSEALGALVPPDTQLMPLAPEELIHALPVFLAHAAGLAQRAGGPGLFSQGRALLGRAVSLPASLLAVLGKRSQLVVQNVWRIEDAVGFTARFAVRAARKAVRPVVLGYIVHRALRTVDASNSLPMRMAKLPKAKATALYYRTLLGDDYEAQMEADLLDAVMEVDEGLITEDYKDEKRLLTAAMLRRLEVEEWDKERMKHFYLGSYGLGPWYFDMEDRLHNPYFIGARAWNGPIEGWVGKNKTYDNDLPLSASAGASSIAAIERALGKRLTSSQRERVLSSEKPKAVDLLLAPGGLLDGAVDPNAVRDHLAAATQQ